MEKKNKLEMTAEENDSGKIIRRAGYAYIAMGVASGGVVGYLTEEPVTAFLAGSVGITFGLLTTYIGRRIPNETS